MCFASVTLHSAAGQLVTFAAEVRNTRIEVDDDGFDDFGRRKTVKKFV